MVLPSLSLSSPEAAGLAAVAAVVAWPWAGAAAAVVALVVVMVSGKGRFRVIPTEPQMPWAKDRVAWKHSSVPVVAHADWTTYLDIPRRCIPSLLVFVSRREKFLRCRDTCNLLSRSLWFVFLTMLLLTVCGHHAIRLPFLLVVLTAHTGRSAKVAAKTQGITIAANAAIFFELPISR